MINPQNQPTSIISTPVKVSSSPDNKMQNALERFATGIQEAFQDIGALEVNTMIVTQITGLKFDPVEKYLAIRDIPRLRDTGNSLDKMESITDIKDEILVKGLLGSMDDSDKFTNYNFREIRTYYERQSWYSEWLKSINFNQTDSQIFEDQCSLVRTIKRHLQLREKLEKAVIEVNSSLVDQSSMRLPDDENTIESLVLNSGFCRKLRKLSELKAIIESPDAANNNNIYDIIYAQTIIQIDGDIINRFDKRLFSDPNQEFLLNVHKSAVLSGEEDWRKLLQSLVDLATKLADFFSSQLK